MTTRISVNGEIGGESAHISVLDRGFLYGDSIYEVLRTYGGQPWALEPHLDRLETSAALLEMVLPIERDVLVSEMRATVAAASNDESYIRIIVTRGAGPIGLDLALAGQPSRIIIVTELSLVAPSLYERGVKVHIVRAGSSAVAATGGAKSGNYLPNILALAQARRHGAHEAILVDGAGHLAEGASSNVFARFGDELCTPPLDVGILEGITRRMVIDLARARGMRVSETRMTPEQLARADEVFLTSTLREVLPVTLVDDTSIGDGAPGPTAIALRRAYRERLGAPLG